MTRTQMGKANGLKAAEVRAGITAGGLPPPRPARQAEQADYGWNLQDLGLLSPFQNARRRCRGF